MEEKQKPDNKFKAGAVTAIVWANEMKDRQGNKFSVYTVAFERNYLLKNGAISKIYLLLQKIFYRLYYRLRENITKVLEDLDNGFDVP